MARAAASEPVRRRRLAAAAGAGADRDTAAASPPAAPPRSPALGRPGARHHPRCAVQVAFPESTIQGGSMYAGGNVGLIIGDQMRALFSTLGSFLVGMTLGVLLLIARSAF